MATTNASRIAPSTLRTVTALKRRGRRRSSIQELQESAGFRAYDDFGGYEKVEIPANRSWQLPRDTEGLLIPPELRSRVKAASNEATAKDIALVCAQLILHALCLGLSLAVLASLVLKGNTVTAILFGVVLLLDPLGMAWVFLRKAANRETRQLQRRRYCGWAALSFFHLDLLVAGIKELAGRRPSKFGDDSADSATSTRRSLSSIRPRSIDMKDTQVSDTLSEEKAMVNDTKENPLAESVIDVEERHNEDHTPHDGVEPHQPFQGSDIPVNAEGMRSVLDYRSARVRSAASALLRYIPTSIFALTLPFLASIADGAMLSHTWTFPDSSADLTSRVVLAPSEASLCLFLYGACVAAATVSLGAVRVAFEVVGVYDLFSRQLRRHFRLGVWTVWGFTFIEALSTTSAIAVAIAAYRFLVPAFFILSMLALRIGTKTALRDGTRVFRLTVLNILAFFPMHSPTGNVSVDKALDRSSWGAKSVTLAKQLGVYTKRRKKKRGIDDALRAAVPEASEGRRYVRIPVGGASRTRGERARRKKAEEKLRKQREKEAKQAKKKQKGKKVQVAAYNPVDAAEFERLEALNASSKRNKSTPTKNATTAGATATATTSGPLGEQMPTFATSPKSEKKGRAREQWKSALPDNSSYLARRHHWNMLFFARAAVFFVLTVLPFIPFLELPAFLINAPAIIGVCVAWGAVCQTLEPGGHPVSGDGFTLSLLLIVTLSWVLYVTFYVAIDRVFFTPGNIEIHTSLRAPGVVAPSTIRVIVARYPTSVREVDENDYNVFHVAATRDKTQRMEILELLMSMNAKQSLDYNADGNTALHLLLKHLIDPGATVDGLAHDKIYHGIRVFMTEVPVSACQVNQHGEFPLHMLVRNPYVNTAAVAAMVEAFPQALLLRDRFGQLPVMYLQQAVYEAGPYLLVSHGYARAAALGRRRPSIAAIVDGMQYVYPQEVQEDPSLVDCVPLEYATRMGHIGMMITLLRAGANPNGSADSLATPLHWACEAGAMDALMVLRAHPNLNLNRGKVGSTPLHTAIASNRPEVISMLYNDRRLDPNVRNGKGETILYTAAIRGDVDSVTEMLEDPRIRVNAATSDLLTPFHGAVIHHQMEVLKLLLRSPLVDINRKNNVGISPYHTACIRGYADVVDMLLRDPRLKKEKGKTGFYQSPFMSACERGHADVVKLQLHTPDLNVNHQKRTGGTPLYWATMGGHVRVVRLLVKDTRVDVNVEDAIGATTRSGHDFYQLAGRRPLHVACAAGYADIVQLLLSRKEIDASLVDTAGDTPLHLAVKRGAVDVVEMLLERYEVNPNIRNSEGKSPISLAKERKDLDLVNLLQRKRGVEGVHQAEASTKKEKKGKKGKKAK